MSHNAHVGSIAMFVGLHCDFAGRDRLFGETSKIMFERVSFSWKQFNSCPIFLGEMAINLGSVGGCGTWGQFMKAGVKCCTVHTKLPPYWLAFKCALRQGYMIYEFDPCQDCMVLARCQDVIA